MPRRLAWLAAVVVLLASLPSARAQTPTAGVVFAVDGSAWLREMSPDLCEAIAATGRSWHVEPFEWSHGPGRIFADLRRQSRHRDKGQELADRIAAYRAAHPDQRIVVVAHSAGAAVALDAAELLPRGTLDRLILLAPAVSSRYELGPALAAVGEGIDSFHSGRDLISHSLSVVGTTDGWNGTSAGSVGFGAADAKLRQYAWQPDMALNGYWGGHFDCTRLPFLRDNVVPLLDASAEVPAGSVAPGAATADIAPISEALRIP